MKIYSSVVEITAATKTRKILVFSKASSSEACEIFSKPMKAQGEMTAIRMIWERAAESGI